MEIRGAQVHASNNEVGLGAGNGQLVVYNLAASQGSTITVSNNRLAGFGIGTFDLRDLRYDHDHSGEQWLRSVLPGRR